jgi:lysophospholipase L1-like esterase
MRRCTGIALVLVLLLSAGANATPRVQISRIALGTARDGHAVILIPVRYPIELNGRKVPLHVSFSRPLGKTGRHWSKRVRLSAGKLRRPNRWDTFYFVHRIDLRDVPAGEVGKGLRVKVTAPATLDVSRDGVPEAHSVDQAQQPLPQSPPKEGVCSSATVTRARPGRQASALLPVCASPVRWQITRQPEHGHARIEGERVVYRPGTRFRGTDSVTLDQAREIRFTVGAPAGETVVRALGDSVTAGFGYYSNGTPMTIGRLLGCRPPGQEFDDACSSNSLVTSNTQALEYAPDYGLANNISWAAQWANEYGVTNFENLAISGSEPSDWAPAPPGGREGEFHQTTERIEAEDPDYILMTIGANPLLSNMLFGVDNMGCAIYSQIFGGYSECVEEAFAEVHLQENLKRLYTDLVQHTDATIYLMQYHLSVPSTALAYSATQVAAMGQLLNREIEKVAGEVSPQRLRVVTPPHFNVGIDVSPVYPSRYSCSRLGYEVDGPSVQSTPTQDELEVLHPLSFCEGPPSGPPWVISGDTGIHPSAAGYAQMASQVPPPAN